MVKWNKLPIEMQTSAVKPYYDILQKKRSSIFIKRVFDFVVSLILLILLSPVIAIIAFYIKLDSKGKVFFKQIRITQYGREFCIYKFRTMIEEAEQIGAQVTLSNDFRVTRVGKTLRKYRLDEIPQLLNVLKGDMSFVGARPEVKKYVNEYTDEMRATLLLPAGITSEASILYKDEANLLDKAEDVDAAYINYILPRKMNCNLKGIKRFGFWNDIKIMFMTVFAVLSKNDKYGSDDINAQHTRQ